MQEKPKPDVLLQVRHHKSKQGVDTYRMEQHAVSYPGLDILGSGVAGILPQEFPRLALAVESKQATELGLTGSAVVHAAIAGQNSAPKGVDHVFFRIHAHLQEAGKKF